MSNATVDSSAAPASGLARVDLFLISWLILFLELACIRWFPAHVLFLTFFTNVVLLACFVGMSVGCLAARSERNWLTGTPWLLLAALVIAHGVEIVRLLYNVVPDVGQKSAQVVYFGADKANADIAAFMVPIDLLGGFFFLILALIFIGPGQELGRALDRVPNRIQAYTINIFGSIIGIVSFALCSYLYLSPLVWFSLAAAGVIYFAFRLPALQAGRQRWLVTGLAAVAMLGVVMVASRHTGRLNPYVEHHWSPYYRIDYYSKDDKNLIRVNLIGHQEMIARQKPNSEYALPHLWQRDTRAHPFDEVLIIGAGSGNDVARALQYGAKHVDAVEIDPVINKLGRQDHPNKPYDDPRVTIHLDDGRNFLRSTPKKYDLIIYALVDSLVLHSSYSNIRLESYLFTEQAFRDVKERLKPDGLFVMYNYFRQGWIVGRISNGLETTFGEAPLVIPLSASQQLDPMIGPESDLDNQFTIFVAGEKPALQPLRQAFDKNTYYWLPRDKAPTPESGNGFTRTDHPGAIPPANAAEKEMWQKERDQWLVFQTAKVTQPPEQLKAATDDWPFLYLREPIVPPLSLRGMAMMGGLALVLIFVFFPRGSGQPGAIGADVRMFFLGAGFMLVETKAVVHMALLFGSTWIVNSIVFLAVLIMILLANIYVLSVKPKSLLPYAIGLFLSLLLNALIPLDWFLGMDPTARISVSCLLVFAPILFAAVIFALSFAGTPAADRAFGANIAGAMLGGLAENASMVLGFQNLIFVAVLFYAVALAGRMPAR